MQNVIVAFSKPEDARKMKGILVRSGYDVVAACTSGSQVLAAVDGLNGGVVVSGYRFQDMIYRDIAENMPKYFTILLLASPEKVEEPLPEGVVFVPMPIKVHDLVESLDMMLFHISKMKKRDKKDKEVRSVKDQELVAAAKKLLMDRNKMTEPEAHRYIQKCAMNAGTSITETAVKIISLITA